MAPRRCPITRGENGKLLREPVYSKVDDEMVRGGKENLTDSGTHVPLIASQPETVLEGQVVDDLVDMSDILPILAAPCLIPRFDRHAVRMRDIRPDVSLGTDPSHGDIFLRHRLYPQLIIACFPQRMATTR